MEKILNHEYVSPEARELLKRFAEHSGMSMEDAIAWNLDVGIRRSAHRARHRTPGSWAGHPDKKHSAPGRRAKKGAKSEGLGSFAKARKPRPAKSKKAEQKAEG